MDTKHPRIKLGITLVYLFSLSLVSATVEFEFGTNKGCLGDLSTGVQTDGVNLRGFSQWFVDSDTPPGTDTAATFVVDQLNLDDVSDIDDKPTFFSVHLEGDPSQKAIGFVLTPSTLSGTVKLECDIPAGTGLIEVVAQTIDGDLDLSSSVDLPIGPSSGSQGVLFTAQGATVTCQVLINGATPAEIIIIDAGTSPSSTPHALSGGGSNVIFHNIGADCPRCTLQNECNDLSEYCDDISATPGMCSALDDTACGSTNDNCDTLGGGQCQRPSLIDDLDSATCICSGDDECHVTHICVRGACQALIDNDCGPNNHHDCNSLGGHCERPSTGDDADSATCTCIKDEECELTHTCSGTHCEALDGGNCGSGGDNCVASGGECARSTSSDDAASAKCRCLRMNDCELEYSCEGGYCQALDKNQCGAGNDVCTSTFACSRPTKTDFANDAMCGCNGDDDCDLGYACENHFCRALVNYDCGDDSVECMNGNICTRPDANDVAGDAKCGCAGDSDCQLAYKCDGGFCEVLDNTQCGTNDDNCDIIGGVCERLASDALADDAKCICDNEWDCEVTHTCEEHYCQDLDERNCGAGEDVCTGSTKCERRSKGEPGTAAKCACEDDTNCELTYACDNGYCEALDNDSCGMESVACANEEGCTRLLPEDHMNDALCTCEGDGDCELTHTCENNYCEALNGNECGSAPDDCVIIGGQCERFFSTETADDAKCKCVEDQDCELTHTCADSYCKELDPDSCGADGDICDSTNMFACERLQTFDGDDDAKCTCMSTPDCPQGKICHSGFCKADCSLAECSLSEYCDEALNPFVCIALDDNSCGGSNDNCREIGGECERFDNADVKADAKCKCESDIDCELTHSCLEESCQVLPEDNCGSNSDDCVESGGECKRPSYEGDASSAECFCTIDSDCELEYTCDDGYCQGLNNNECGKDNLQCSGTENCERLQPLDPADDALCTCTNDSDCDDLAYACQGSYCRALDNDDCGSANENCMNIGGQCERFSITDRADDAMCKCDKDQDCELTHTCTGNVCEVLNNGECGADDDDCTATGEECRRLQMSDAADEAKCTCTADADCGSKICHLGFCKDTCSQPSECPNSEYCDMDGQTSVCRALMDDDCGANGDVCTTFGEQCERLTATDVADNAKCTCSGDEACQLTQSCITNHCQALEMANCGSGNDICMESTECKRHQSGDLAADAKCTCISDADCQLTHTCDGGYCQALEMANCGSGNDLQVCMDSTECKRLQSNDHADDAKCTCTGDADCQLTHTCDGGYCQALETANCGSGNDICMASTECKRPQSGDLAADAKCTCSNDSECEVAHTCEMNYCEAIEEITCDAEGITASGWTDDCCASLNGNNNGTCAVGSGGCDADAQCTGNAVCGDAGSCPEAVMVAINDASISNMTRCCVAAPGGGDGEDDDDDDSAAAHVDTSGIATLLAAVTLAATAWISRIAA